MKLGPDEAQRIAHLARLRLSDDEARQMARDLSAILEYVEKLAELDTSGVEPLAHVVPVAMPAREDRMVSDFPRALTTANAPEAEQAMFRVPQVIEE